MSEQTNTAHGFSLKKTGIIFRKEFRAFFLSPLAYIVIVLFLVAIGWFFFSRFFLYNQLEMRQFFALLPITYAVVSAAITMGLFSNEFSHGSYEIINTAATNTLDIVLGKFFAAFAFMVIVLVPTVAYPISLSFLGELDWGPVIGGYLGALFLIAAFASIGIFFSSISKNIIIAFIISLAVGVVLGINIQEIVVVLGGIGGFIANLSASHHFDNIAKGVIDLRNILYFLSIVVIALYATKLRLDERK